MITCPRPESLHAFVDGELSAPEVAAIDRHLPECPECRDIVRAVRRIDLYLDRPWSGAPRELVVHDRPTAGARAADVTRPEWSSNSSSPKSGTARRAGLRFVLAVAAVAASVLVVVTLRGPAGHDDGPLTAAPSPSSAGLLRVLAEAGAPSWSPAELLRRAGELEPTLAGPKAARWIRDEIAETSEVEAALLLGRLAAAQGLSEFRPRVEDLASAPGTEASALRLSLEVLADFGGRDAAYAIRRVAARRPVPPRDLAAALLRTGAPNVASEVQRLLRQAGEESRSATMAIANLPGRPAAKRLVEAFLAGDDAPELEAAILRRPEALEVLREALVEQPTVDRVRAYRLLVRAGDRSSLRNLEKIAALGPARSAAVAALGALASDGSKDAIEALVRVLPVPDGATGTATAFGEDDPVVRALRALSLEAASHLAVLLARRDGEFARGADRRRCLVAAGLVGGDALSEGLVRALARSDERRAALVGLGFLAQPGTVSAVLATLRDSDRAVRHAAIDALVRIGGDEASKALARSLSRSEDRRTLVLALDRASPEFALPILSEGLRYGDVKAECRHAIAKRTRDAPGPTSTAVSPFDADLTLNPGP